MSEAITERKKAAALGPFEAVGSSSIRTPFAFGDQGQPGLLVATMNHATPDAPAITQLFAASPAVLAALKHLVQWHDQLGPKDIAMAEAAIAQAEGRA